MSNRGACKARWGEARRRTGPGRRALLPRARVPALRLRSRPRCASASAVGRRRNDEANRAHGGLEFLPREFEPLCIQLQGKRTRGIFTLRQRHIDALHSLGRRLRAQHHPRATTARTPECGGELHILQRLIQNQPAPFTRLRRAYNLAILRLPLSAAEHPRRCQRRTLEGPVRHKVPVRPRARQQQERARGDGNRATDLLPHTRSPHTSHFGHANAAAKRPHPISSWRGASRRTSFVLSWLISLPAPSAGWHS